MAATAPAPPPIPMKDASVGFSPAFTIAYWTVMAVEEPGAVTPMRRPLKSAADLISPALPLSTEITMAGKRPSSQVAVIA